MRRFLCIALLLCPITASSLLQAQNFKTEKLRLAAEMLGISASLDTIPPCHSVELMSKDGLPVIVRTNRQQAVEHIGYPLFSEAMRALVPSPVYDFMEYALLNWKYKFTPNTLYLSKVLFKTGNWNTLMSSTLKDCDCSIENREDRLYVVTWQREGEPLAVVGIPIEYELLSNESRRNVEKDFIHQLSVHQPEDRARVQKKVMEDDLKIYGTEGLFVIQGESYLLPELNQNIYYQLKTVYLLVDTLVSNRHEIMTYEDVVPAVVIDQEHPNETFANLIMNDGSDTPDADINLDFHLSDYHRETLSLSLNKLKDYFAQEGCKLYFASSGKYGENLRGMLFATNIAKGYNHLLSLTVPLCQLTAEKPEIQAAVYLFIPPIDKSHLFGKTPTKKSGAKIQLHL